MLGEKKTKVPKPVKAFAVLDSDGTIKPDWIHKTRLMADMSGGRFGLDVIPVLITPIETGAKKRAK